MALTTANYATYDNQPLSQTLSHSKYRMAPNTIKSKSKRRYDFSSYISCFNKKAVTLKH